MNGPLYTDDNTPHIPNPHTIAENKAGNDIVPAPSVPNRRILLLEDDPFFGSFLQEFLLKKGFHVQLLNDGEAGLCTLSQKDFDIVICDIILPGLPGIDLYLSVRDTKPALCERFIFITGSYNQEGITEFIESIKGRLLYKPFHIAELMQRISEVNR